MQFTKSVFICVNLWFLLFSVCGCSAQQQVRPAAVAGQFYPDKPEELSSMVDGFLSQVTEDKTKGKLVTLLVPHAGYVFSGQVAAYGYKQIIDAKYDTIIIIGLSHKYHLGNQAAIYTRGYFETPLGKIKIDSALADALCQNSSLIKENTEAHADEHCIEVQLPFLQRTLKTFEIVPILMSNPELSVCQQIGTSIVQVIKKQKNKRILVICSTDMTHYPSYDDAVNTDKQALSAMSKYDLPLLKQEIDSLMSQGINNLACVFCAEGAVFTVMQIAKDLGADTVEILKYANSGDVSYGNKSQVVGYSAVAYTTTGKQKKSEPVKEKETKMKSDTQNPEFKLSSETQKEMLSLARQSIESALNNITLSYKPTTEEMKKPAAVFVTLQKNGQLRGCIGTTVAQAPLYQTVEYFAKAAAFEDTRFPQVTKSELKELHIEISVLSPMVRVNSADEIKPHLHGVVVKQGFHSGLFLPQVWEHFSNKEDFLNELCHQKAGLPPTAWKDPGKVELYIFTVFAFEEKK